MPRKFDSTKTLKKEVKKGNGLLQAAQFTIPYIKELKELDGVNSTLACLIMAQIEYWNFVMKGKPFYKFTTPPKKEGNGYKKGQSWTEELGVSKGQFDRAFSEIGVHYGSLTDYLEASKGGDAFRGRFYCSYLHKPSHQTYYLRNKNEVEKAIKIILKLRTESGEATKSDLPNSDNVDSGNSSSRVAETAESGVVYTDTTTDTTADISPERAQGSLRDSLLDKKARNRVEKEEETLVGGIGTEGNQDEVRPNSNVEVEERKIIPSDFSPTWDAKYRAMLQFPNKLASWVTEKFIRHYQARAMKLTRDEWHAKWWDWMQSEKETHGNEKLAEEHNEILNYLADEVLEASWYVPYVFDWEDMATHFDSAYSEETLTNVMFRLYEVDKLGGVGDLHYFNNEQRKDCWEDIEAEIDEKGLVDEVIYIHSLPNRRASLRRLRQMAQERAEAKAEAEAETKGSD